MYEEELKVAVSAVREAGRILRDGYYKKHDVEIKENRHEIVTEMDKSADEAIRGIIESAFPGHAVKSEESPPKRGDKHTWYIDPLDGTTNYTTKVPFFASAVGMTDGDEPVLSAVYNPAVDELFAARKGGGATLNNRTIRVSGNKDVKKTMINFCHKSRPESVERVAQLFAELKKDARDLRQLGAGTLDICYVACGRNDAFFNDSKIWDFVPSIVVAREAGARITDWSGGPWGVDSENILVTNGRLHDYMLEKLRDL